MTTITSSSSLPPAAQPPAVPIPHRLLLDLTAGVIGTALFAVIYLIEGATRPGYDTWRDTISALSFGPDGWVQRANFILCGLSVLWLAVIWRAILRGGPCARWYPIIHAVEGVGLFGLGAFPMDPLHTASMVVTMGAMALSLAVIARRFWRDPRWRGWTAFSLACALWPNLVLPLFGLALNPQSPLAGYTGLIERVATSPDIVWGLVILIPLWAGRPLAHNPA